MYSVSSYIGPVSDYSFNQSHTQYANITNEQNGINHLISSGNLYRTPTIDNPMMNVPIMSYDAPQIFNQNDLIKNPQNPTKLTETTKHYMESAWNNNLFQDPGDYFFKKTNSQRQWFTPAIDSVPNNQDSFASWLYSVPGNCKHGSINMRYGNKYSDDSLLCTGYNAAEPTNFGILK